MAQRLIFVLLLSFPFAILAQDNDIKLGSVWFKSKSARLTNSAKATLDSLSRRIIKRFHHNKGICLHIRYR